MAGSPQGSDLELAHEARHREGQGSSEFGHSPLAGSEVGAVTPIQKAKGPASAATDPDHGSTIPAEETAMNRPNDATRPVDPAMPDFKAAFEGLQNDLLVLERRFHTADFLLDGVTERETDQHGVRRISETEVDAIRSTMDDTRDALIAVMTVWRTTHNANCDAEFRAFAAGRAAA